MPQAGVASPAAAYSQTDDSAGFSQHRTGINRTSFLQQKPPGIQGVEVGNDKIFRPRILRETRGKFRGKMGFLL